MSIKLIDAVWSLKLDNEGELLVLLALADNANDEGTHCFPSQRRIAWKTDLTVKSVSAIIARLEKKGLVETLNKGNQHRPTNYALHLEKGIQKEAFIPSPWAGDKVESTPTEVQVKSVKAEVHAGGSEMHGKESELHLHDGELHVDTTKTNVDCGQQTTSSSQPSGYPSGYPSGETHDPVKPVTDAAAPAAPGASPKAEEKAAGKETIEDNSFPRPLPHWMESREGVPGVVFRVPELMKFGGAHPRAVFYLGNVRVTIWKSDLIARLDSAEGKLLVGVGKWRLYEGKKEFVITSIARQSAEDIAAQITGKPTPAKAEPVRKPQPLSPDNPLVVENVAHMRKFPQTRESLGSVLKDPMASEIMNASARVLLAEMPPEVKPPAPIRRVYQECPF